MPYLKSNDPLLAHAHTYCVICENASDICWISPDRCAICVCLQCATEELPVLIAEVATAKNPDADLDAVLQTIAERFYRGAALGLQRSYKCAITPPIPRR